MTFCHEVGPEIAAKQLLQRSRAQHLLGCNRHSPYNCNSTPGSSLSKDSQVCCSRCWEPSPGCRPRCQPFAPLCPYFRPGAHAGQSKGLRPRPRCLGRYGQEPQPAALGLPWPRSESGRSAARLQPLERHLSSASLLFSAAPSILTTRGTCNVVVPQDRQHLQKLASDEVLVHARHCIPSIFWRQHHSHRMSALHECKSAGSSNDRHERNASKM